MERNGSRPRVILFMSVWSIVLALLNFGVGALLATLFVSQAEEMKDMPAAFHGARMILLGLIVLTSLAYFVMPFLPRRRSVWVYGIVLLALACMSLVTAPVSIALLIFWVKPDVRSYFGYERPAPTPSLASA